MTTVSNPEAVLQYYAVMADVASLEQDLLDLIHRWREIGKACQLCADHLEDTLNNNSSIADRLKSYKTQQ